MASTSPCVSATAGLVRASLIARGPRMIRTFQFAAAALAATLICSAAGAQRRGGGMSVRMPSARMAPAARASFSTAASFAIPRATRQPTILRYSPNGQMIRGFSTFANSASFRSANAATALGFNNTFSPAPSSGGLRGNLSGNFGRGSHHGRRNSLVPIVVGGYPYYPYYLGDYYDDSADYGQPEQQPVPVPEAQQDVGPGDDTTTPLANSPAPAPAAAVPDVGEFILVRRDGRILFASAFSIIGNQLRYVTPEGIRRSLPMSDLDADATQQMNEARGTTVQLRD